MKLKDVKISDRELIACRKPCGDLLIPIRNLPYHDSRPSGVAVFNVDTQDVQFLDPETEVDVYPGCYLDTDNNE